MSVQNVQVKAQEYLNTLDRELSKSFYANELQRRTGVPKTYFVLGAGAVTFIMIFFNLAGQLLTNAISWIYPGKYIYIYNTYSYFFSFPFFFVIISFK